NSRDSCRARWRSVRPRSRWDSARLTFTTGAEVEADTSRNIPLLVMVELVYKTNRRLKRMAQYQITVDGEVLHQLFRGDEGMAKLLESVVNQVLHAQVTEQLKAAPFERSEERLGYRNGYRAREMKTRVGTLELRVPRV